MDVSYILNDYVTLILLILFAIATLWLCVYYGVIFLKIGRHGRTKKDLKAQLERQKSGRSEDSLPGVSVVLVAQNEGKYLRENLVYLLEQDYPNYEVVVVDYKSTDDTKFILQVCSQNYPNLRSVAMQEDVNMFHGRKLPLSIGIRSAKNDLILLIESDTKPTGFNWIREMVGNYSHKDTKIVLGYCGIAKQKGLLNMMEQYDNICFSAYYLSRALRGKATTGTGRNLSYKKKFFFSQGAFTKHYTEEFGADDLFVNQNADSANTAVCFAPEARVEMEAKKTLKQWHLRRKQRESTFKLHPVLEKVERMTYPLVVLAFYAFMVLLLVKGFPWYFVAGGVAVKMAWQIICFWQLGSQFDVKAVAWLSPLMEIYFWFANTILRISTLHR